MKKLPRILKILDIHGFVIRTQWTTDEVRDIDFAPIIKEWNKLGETTIFSPLSNPDVFKSAAVSDSRTLCWPSVKLSFEFAGVKREEPLDLDPDVLYERSVLVKKSELPAFGKILKDARETAGLSQLQVAINSGISKSYISRIENEHANIQLGVLYRIIKLGIGKDLKFSIE